MTGVSIGQPAPAFRLPTAQGSELALEDFRGKKNVIVWFTKGMGCVFCRQHMSQLARIYPEIQKRNTEVLEIVPSTVDRGRQYAQKYRLPFPYLCDADDRVRHAWQLGVRSHGPLWYAKAFKFGMTAPQGLKENDFSQDPPPVGEMLTMMRDDDAGLYVVDRAGVIRYGHAGSYVDTSGGSPSIRALPPADEILRALERLAA
jgi:peroxiredoxin